jgi:signal transduction histidine kinase
VEYRVANKKGKYIWVESIFSNLLADPSVESIVINFRDVTERKISAEALQESEYRLARAEKVAKIGNWKLMVDTKQIISSPGARIIYGVDNKEMALKDVQKIPLFEYRQMLDTALLDLILRDIPYNFEFKIRRQNDGEIFDVHSIADYDKKNNIVYGVIHDISDRKAAEHLLQQQNEEIEKQNQEYLQINEEYLQLNEELIQTNDELFKAKEKAEESDRLKTAFLQNMSHEIRTPMNAIMGFSELLVENYNNKEKLEKFSEIISQRSNDLLDIINDILNIAKIESGQLPINFEEVSLTELFSELNSFFSEHQKRIGKNQINFSLRTQCPSTKKVIVTDKIKLKQIFINLIGNAFKYTDNGNIEGGCKLDSKSNLVFYVSDTGIGIPKDKHQLIFERFAQLNTSSTKLNSGTGLGLSIVKGLVELLGGEIAVESEPNRGSTFTFSIPYKTSSILNSEIPLVQKPKEFDFRNKTVLIVEDDNYNAEYLKEILSSTGLNILHTEFGIDAVTIALNQKVDLVLMDIRLPDIDGLSATKQIRGQNQSLKIIAQTAYASHIERQKTLEAGCNDYISKPINKELLLDMISKHLNY